MKNLFFFAAFTLLLAVTVAAQDARATLTGRVTDATAVVPGAKVQAYNQETGTRTTTTTNAEGNFEIPYLLPGVYRVTVALDGFKTALFSAVQVEVGDRKLLDVTLETGLVSDAVEVTAEAPLLDVANSSIGLVVDGRRAAELPIVGGNPFTLARTAPGVSAPGGRFFGNPMDYNVATEMSVNGTRTGGSEVTLDGVPNMAERVGAFSPPQDLVQEFRIQTATYDAALGHAVGAVTNVSIKSGTKDLHGTGYYNDSRVRAIPWFTNRFIYDPTSGPIDREKIARNTPSWLHQRWGATATGPLVIPKFYNGREKTFWSFGYEGLNIRRNANFTGTFPTEKQRGGDFSDLLKLGANYQIYNPFTTRAAANGRFSREPFAGNIIPGNLISPIARKLLDFYPLPNQPGTAEGRNNYFTTQDIVRGNVSYLGRVDHSFSDRHRMFARYNYNNYDQTDQAFASQAVGGINNQYGHGVALDDVFTFSPSLILNLRYGLTYQRPSFYRQHQGFDLLGLGFPQSLLNEIRAKNNAEGVTFPAIAPEGFSGLGADGGNFRTVYYHTFGGTVTKIVRSHSLRTGAEFRLLRENGFNFGNVAPSFTFGSTYTRGPLDSAAAAPFGQGLAAFLLGIPTAGAVNINASRAQQSTYSAVFLHDDWRVTRRLGVNVGVRYEYEGAPTERFNRSLRGFDATAPSPVTAAAAAAYARSPIPEVAVSAFRTNGGLTFAGVNGQPRQLWAADRNNFAPRLGLAFQLFNKTVLRAGYGIFYDVVGIDRTDVNQGGFNQTTNLIPTTDNGLTYTGTLANPFPNGFVTPTGAAAGLATFLGRDISFFNGTPANPYVQRWSFSVQHELPGRTLVEVSYVGNRGARLGVVRNLNALPLQYLSTSPERDQTRIDFLTAQVNNPFFNLPEFAGSALNIQRVGRQQLLRPFPHFGAVNVSENAGYSWYHSLQTSVEKRLTRGLTFQASWTWSKFMEAINRLNEADPLLEEVISDADRKDRLVATLIWDLPLGKGRRFFGGAGRVLNTVIGGWQVQGIYEGQSGPPLGFGNGLYSGDLRNIVLPRGQRTSDRWFNTQGFVALRNGNTVVLENGRPVWVDFNDPCRTNPACAVRLTNPQGFNRDASFQLANNARTLPTRFGFFRGDGINNFDLSFFKNFAFTERLRGQFRVEAYNAFNHVQFTGPNTTPTSTALGTITTEKDGGQRLLIFGFKLIF